MEAHDVIHGQPDLFDVFQRTDMGGAFGAASTQHDTHLGPWSLDGVI